MSDNFVIKAQVREDLGKGASRRLRRADKLPAVLYGSGDPVSLTLSHAEMILMVENEAFFSHILELDIDGNKENAIVRDMQRHPFKNLLTHIDFQRVVAGQEITVSVPVHFINEETSKGVKLEGGEVHHLMTEIEVVCMPRHLPEYIEVDIAELGLGETLHLSDLKMPEGVKSVALSHGEEHDDGVVSITKPHVIAEEPEEEEAGEVAADEVPTAKDEEEAKGDE
ncbi:ribosomal protein L25, Ctc-form [gamma proteobacterium HTCC5015]|nr:ribosomal protein L25, Ctc-form [gamma proteobacterium HTCC5015]